MSGKEIKKRYIVAAALMALFIAAIVGLSATGAQAQSQARLPLGSPVATTAKMSLLDQPVPGGATSASIAVNARGLVLGGPFNDGWYWLDFSGKKGYALGKSIVIVDDKYTPVPEGTQQPTVAPTSPATSTVQPVASKTAVAVEATATLVSATPVPTTDPLLGKYTGLMLAELSSAGNVRSAPGTDKPRIKGWAAGRRVLLYEAVKDSKGDTWYRVSEPPEEPQYVHSSLVKLVESVKFEGAKYKGRWVNVNLSQQITTAYENGKPVMVTLCSTGKGDNSTTLGVWKIYWRLPKQDMKGGNLASGDYYSLKDVPFPQYFHNTGEALHGTYWHDDFGHPHSHGCVNLSTPISEWFYNWDVIGTVVWVHN